MFGPLVLSPQLPERTSLQQAQGAAKPLHVWPGESAQEMARNFDQLLERDHAHREDRRLRRGSDRALTAAGACADGRRPLALTGTRAGATTLASRTQNPRIRLSGWS